MSPKNTFNTIRSEISLDGKLIIPYVNYAYEVWDNGFEAKLIRISLFTHQLIKQIKEKIIHALFD